MFSPGMSAAVAMTTLDQSTSGSGSMATSFARASVEPKRKVAEFRVSPENLIDVGAEITAAHFIQRFIDDGVAWAHLDIAGMAWSDKAKPTYDKGATGYGVRLLDQLVADTAETR